MKEPSRILESEYRKIRNELLEKESEENVE